MISQCPVELEREINQFKGLNYRYWMSVCWDNEFVTKDKMVRDITRYSLWLSSRFKTHIKQWAGIEQCENPHAHIILRSNKRLREGFARDNKDSNGKRLVRVFDGWKHSAKRKQNHITIWNPELSLRGVAYSLFKHENIGNRRLFHPGNKDCLNGRCLICSTDGKGGAY